MHRLPVVITAALLMAMLTACALASESGPENTRSVTPATTPTTFPEPSPSPVRNEQTAQAPVVGTIVRFATDRTIVDVTIGEDSPGVRDFLSMLPLEVTVEEFAGSEKIAYLPRELNHTGSPGSDPEDGDLIYFTPWGNLGFYYDTTGIGYSDATLHIGSYDATQEQLSLLEGGPVTIAVVD